MVLIVSTCSLRIRLWKARFLLFADTKIGEKTCLTLSGLTRDARRCGFRAELFGLGERARSCDSSFHRGTCVAEKASWLQPPVRRCSQPCQMALVCIYYQPPLSKPECLRYDITAGKHDFSGESLPGSSNTDLRSGSVSRSSQRNAKKLTEAAKTLQRSFVRSQTSQTRP
jgi:hypothetical protein